MKDFLPYVVFGLTIGSVYGLAAMGLVLTYKTSGLFNFGHGAVGAAAAYVFFELRQRQGVPWPLAAILAVLVFGALLGLLLERLAQALAPTSTTYKIVGTIALLLLIRGLAILIYGPQFQIFKPFLPQETAFTLTGVMVTYENVIIFLLGLVAAVLLYLLFNGSRTGTAMRAVVDDAALLDLTGQAPAAVRRRAWLIGSCFAAASGVLFASQQQQLDATLLSLLVVQAFGAAAIGRFTNLPMAYVGGLGVGLFQQLASKQLSSVQALQGLDYNIPFVVLFVVLLVVPKRKLVDLGQTARVVAPAQVALSKLVRSSTAGVALVMALVVPLVVGTKLPLWSNAVSQVGIFLALGLLVRTSGQISLCHIGLAAVGAAGFGHALESGLPWGLAVLVGGAVAIPVGAIIAIPAIRLSGLYLALATLGFGVLLSQFFYVKSFMFGLSDLHTARPHVAGLETDKGYYYLLLGFAVVGMVAVRVVERSRLGRLLQGMGDSPTAMVMMGADINVTKVIVFCLSAFIAGISGALFAGQFGSVSGDSFNYVQSLVVLAVLITAGRSTLVASVVGPILLFVLPGYLNSPTASEVLQVLFGAAALLVAIFSTGAVGGSWRHRAEAAGWRLSNGTTAARTERLRALSVASFPIG